MLRGRDQQVRRTLPLLPERGALARPAPGEQQRARRGLAERAREQRRPGEHAHDLFLDLVGIEQQVVERDPILGLGQADHDAVVAPQHLRAGADALREPRLDRQAPRRVHALAERRQDAHAPVADLVAEAFDHDRAVVGDGAGRLALIVKVLDQVLRRELVEPDVIAQALERIGTATGRELARERAERAAQLERPARACRPSRTASCRARPERGRPRRGRA